MSKLNELSTKGCGESKADMQNSVKQEVNKQIEEDREIEKRKNNIIIYRVPEIN